MDYILVDDVSIIQNNSITFTVNPSYKSKIYYRKLSKIYNKNIGIYNNFNLINYMVNIQKNIMKQLHGQIQLTPKKIKNQNDCIVLLGLVNLILNFLI